jgi:50S ribosomal subunit-associated GTPase HflX
MKNTLEITKAALEERIANLKNELRDLKSTDSQLLEERAERLLESALAFYPEAKVQTVNTYSDSIYINVKDEDGRLREILSIHRREYSSDYLNTYATTLDTEFELKRLAFNGKVAELFLNDSDLFEKLFADSEYTNTIDQLLEEVYIAEKALYETNNKIQQAALDEKLAKLKAGEEIEFEKPKNITTGSSKYDWVDRVISIKAEWTSKKKMDVTFTCKAWMEEDPNRVWTKTGVHEKYILQAIY